MAPVYIVKRTATPLCGSIFALMLVTVRGEIPDMSKSDSAPLLSLDGADRAWIESAMRRGASRREVLGWLMAGGASLASAGSIKLGRRAD
jgi:hypothetical protein